ncbi:Uncharacterised protein [uncultured archaeon]|nr:Uncharacterised protein [uncultured archaeon]
MAKIERSTYIRISKTLLRKLFRTGCWGAGSMYEEHLKEGFPKEDADKAILVADALVRQGILGKKRKLYGFKYFLREEMYEKIMEIIQ